MHPIVRHQGRVRLYEGDSREVLKRIPDSSIDSVVCDPPYALVSVLERFGGDNAAPAKFGTDGLYARASSGFLGQKWDTGETAFAVTFWQEVLRVLKPGGHVVAFGGTRTYHHLATAIELAGFEIRDQLGWLYGTGFPKSHNVAKGLAKRRVEDEEPTRVVCRFVRAAMEGRGLVSRDLTPHFGGCAPRLIDHWAARDTDSQPSLPTPDQWAKLVGVLGLASLADFAEVEAEVARLNARKGLHGDQWTTAKVVGTTGTAMGFGDYVRFHGDPTIRKLDGVAAEWDGWGTGLKPAWEPICLARKPLAGRSVADNVLQLGVGALNIEACRIGEDRRFPANILHDGSEEVEGFFPSGAARFFYSAKASKADREEGLEHLPIPEGKTRRNIHPTVKPTPVMAYFARLVTPPGGVVLDPFMGSGSTGKAAVMEGFHFIGIDAQPEFIPIAEARIAFAAAKYLPAPAPDPDLDPEPLKELEYEGY